MFFVSITRLRLRSVIQLLPFLWHAMRANKQLTRRSSFVKGKVCMDKKLTFWTMTLWHNDADMRAYRNSDAHKKAMPKLQHWCSEASIVHWLQEDYNFPTWLAAYERMKAEGRLSKVRRPSNDHLAFNIAPPTPPARAEQVLLPQKV